MTMTPPTASPSQAIQAALLVSVLATSGCADLLGLDGLTFDRTTAPQETDASGGAGGGRQDDQIGRAHV